MGYRQVYVNASNWLLRLSFALLAGGVVMEARAQADEAPIKLGNYELGRGLALGDTGFTLGGYATLRLEKPQGDGSDLSLSHASVMLWWEGLDRFRFFSEFDAEKGSPDDPASRPNERFYSLERAYLEYAVNDTTSLRGGKFLTPIGRWNLIHADPLVWTTSRPLVTDQVFPASSTGGMLLGTLPVAGRDMDYMLFSAFGKAWRSKPDEDPFSEARGLRVNLPVSEALQVGASLATFEQENDQNDHKKLGGLDFLWARQRWEVSGEGVYRSSSHGADQAEWGGYLQVVAPLEGRLYAVGRGEVFRFAGASNTSHGWVLGLNFRYSRAMSLKAEVVDGEHLPDNFDKGFLASISVLF